MNSEILLKIISVLKYSYFIMAHKKSRLLTFIIQNNSNKLMIITNLSLFRHYQHHTNSRYRVCRSARRCLTATSARQQLPSPTL